MRGEVGYTVASRSGGASSTPLLVLPLFFIAAGSAPGEFSVVIGASKNDNNSVGSEYFSVKFFGRTSIKIWKTYIYKSHQIFVFENYVVVPSYTILETLTVFS